MAKCASRFLALTLSTSLALSPALSWADGAPMKGSIVAPSDAPQIMNLGRLNFRLSPILAGGTAAPAPTLSSVLPLAAAVPIPVAHVKAEARAVEVLPASPEKTAAASLNTAAVRIAQGRQAPQQVLAETFDYFSIRADQIQGTLPTIAPGPADKASARLLPSTKRMLAATAATMALASPVFAGSAHSQDLPSFSGAAFLGMIGGWLLGRKGGPNRDADLTNGLLAEVKIIRETIDDAHPESTPAAAALGLSILTGDYAQARLDLDTIVSASVGPETKARALALRSRLPERNFPGERELKKAWEEVQSTLTFDPFEIQSRLSRLMDGIFRANAPWEVKDRQIDIRQKASFLARKRAQERKTPGPEIALQKFEDCWLHSLYYLPSPVLEPVRSRVSYEGFLNNVRALFPTKNFKEHGLDPEEFRQVLGLLGLEMKAHEVTEEGLAQLLRAHGSVLGAVVWFTKDTSNIDAMQALPFFRRHAVAITGVVDTPEGRQFIVRDSLVPWLTRYTKEELDMLSLAAMVIEPEAPGSVEKKSEQFLRKP